jgi:hypothetical protein
MLINWFKDNFKDREYLKFMKRARSPKTRQLDPDQVNARISGNSN